MKVWGCDAYWRLQELLKKKIPLWRASFLQLSTCLALVQSQCTGYFYTLCKNLLLWETMAFLLETVTRVSQNLLWTDIKTMIVDHIWNTLALTGAAWALLLRAESRWQRIRSFQASISSHQHHQKPQRCNTSTVFCIAIFITILILS